MITARRSGRTVAAIPHQVLDLPLPFDVAGVAPGYCRPSELWLALVFAIAPFIPARDGESGMRGFLHVPFPRDRERLSLRLLQT